MILEETRPEESSKVIIFIPMIIKSSEIQFQEKSL